MHPFTIPFMAGFTMMFIVLIIRYSNWFRGFSTENRKRIAGRMFTRRSIHALNEIFRESLLHLKIYKTNPILGYMHMSLAFGWFLLIVGGKLETWYYTGNFANPPQYAIFFRFFHPVTEATGIHRIIDFYMEFSLLVVLSGLTIAMVKRIRKQVAGMKNTTRHTLTNRLALTFLWFIFPLRLLAESATTSIHGGGSFLTGITSGLPFHPAVELPLWWAYSISLGVFFVCLPFSRYLHIPTEMITILLKKWGVEPELKLKTNKGLQAFEIHSCSGCGICLDACPAIGVGDKKFQSVYFINEMRNGKDHSKTAELCLSCGSCQQACPVGIQLEPLRISARENLNSEMRFNHTYLPSKMILWRETTDVILFTGCMGRMNPRTTQSMKKLFDEAGIGYVHADEDENICCGRPMVLTGASEQAELMMSRNRDIIHSYNAKVLVTTCPICYKQFKNSYKLNIPVVHHSMYINQLMEEGKLNRHHSNLNFSYHDPCELGRAFDCYEAPREVLKRAGHVVALSKEKEKSLCCGNNMGTILLERENRQQITDKTLMVLSENNPDYIVTSCPVCKNTLSQQSSIPVRDIAEVLTDLPEIKQKTGERLTAMRESHIN
ncbi:Fe-S oxidoreductase [Natronoflexus pectinivorans]|uniref:Fe-S oxidoreductase n=2 Tax=Natronoflexus pectinivorans TaxID=682526 RepID=A0A4R2GFY3_9BACT|nr:Fe-S oxidoreductase [Natronoflexus pectinivorans]